MLSYLKRSLGKPEKLLQLSLFFLTAFLLLTYILPLLMPGIPTTHDGEGHVARAANYAVALRQGQLPPRWAPSFWNGFGYPVFNFYYPLLSMLSAPFVLTGVHPELAVKVWLIIGLSAISTAWILLGKKLANLTTGFVASGVILLSHYFFNLLHVRGAYGEFFAYVSLSLLFLSCVYYFSAKTNSLKTSWLAGIWLSTVALSLSHNLMAVMFVPLAGLTLFSYSIIKKMKYAAAIGFTLGVLVTSFFWIPAITELHLTVFDQIQVHLLDHFPTLTQLFLSPVQQGQSQLGNSNEMSFNISPFTILILIATGLTTLTNASLKNRRLIGVLLLLAMGLFFLMTTYSSQLWETFSASQVMQFPWRLLGPLTLTTALLSILVYPQLPAWSQKLILVALFTLAVERVSWKLRDNFHFPKEYYLNYTQTSTVQDELRAKTWFAPVWKQSSSSPITPEGVQVTVNKWRGSYRDYQLTTSVSAQIVEPTMYFPGWEVQIDAKKIPVTVEAESGQLGFEVPAGSHRVVTRFTQNTPARTLGNLLSVISLILSIVFFGVLSFNKSSEEVKNTVKPLKNKKG